MGSEDKLERNVLPIPDRPRTGLVTYDAKDPSENSVVNIKNKSHSVTAGVDHLISPEDAIRIALVRQ